MNSRVLLDAGRSSATPQNQSSARLGERVSVSVSVWSVANAPKAKFQYSACRPPHTLYTPLSPSSSTHLETSELFHSICSRNRPLSTITFVVQTSANNLVLLHFSIVVLTSAETCSLFPCGRSRGPLRHFLQAYLSLRATEQGFSLQLVSITPSLPTQLSRPVYRYYNCPSAFNRQFRSLQS
jgi:hypothetical protein